MCCIAIATFFGYSPKLSSNRETCTKWFVEFMFIHNQHSTWNYFIILVFFLCQLNAGFDDPPVEMSNGSVMRGTPVCAGRVKATVRVVLSVEDADQIQEVLMLAARLSHRPQKWRPGHLKITWSCFLDYSYWMVTLLTISNNQIFYLYTYIKRVLLLNEPLPYAVP